MKKYKKILLIIIIAIFMMCNTSICATSNNSNNEMKVLTNADLKNSIKRSKYNLLINDTAKNAGELEEKYNLKDNIKNINVKDQMSSGSCWAFAYTNILETSIAKQNNKLVEKYSPMHIEYQTAQTFSRKVGGGAGTILATAYSTAGYGPILEEKMPFNKVFNVETSTYASLSEIGSLEKGIDARVKGTKMFPEIYKTKESEQIKYYGDLEHTITYSETEVKTIRDLVKQHVKTYGAISADIYMDETNFFDKNNSSYNYNNYTNPQSSNHVVTIVGWDDAYGIDKFKEGCKPTKPGAYIALNSYGEEWGEQGYMYISYEDVRMEETLLGITNVKEYENGQKDYDKMYQYDELGMNLMLPIGGQTITDENTKSATYTLSSINNPQTSLYAANKYKRQVQAEKDEYIDEIGLYIATTSGVQIYINKDNDNFENAELVASPKEALESGYHTIKLASPLKLTGEKFAVKVKYTNQEGAYLPIEANYKDFGVEEKESFYETATANSQESFISTDDTTWGDVNNSVLVMNGENHKLQNANACIKVFSTLQDKVPEEEVRVENIRLNKTQTTIEEGKTDTLIAIIEPENATNKNITWKSSNENIATVKDGIVTAIKEGNAEITATTEDGNKTATAKVTVQKTKVPEEVKVESIRINKTQITIKEGKTETLTATIEPENATNKNITWKSANENIAKVNMGVVTGINEGETTITATAEDGKVTTTCKVYVEKEAQVPPNVNVEVTSIKLNKTNMEVEVGDIFNLEVTFNPENATNKEVKWTTSNEKVLTVSERGIITAIAQGEAIITVTAEDGNKVAKCKITVKQKTNNDDDIYNDDEKNNTNNNSNQNTDKTTIDKQIPFAGGNIAIIISVIFIVTLAIVSYIKYKSLNDIK